MNTTEKTNMLVKMALLSAISIVLMVLIRIPAPPPVTFLVYDPADIPILLAAFAFGPIAGLMVTAVVSVIQAFPMGGDGIIGFSMHMLATGAFVIVAGNIYRRNKTKKTALIAMILGAVAMVATMGMWNILITPIYMGVPRQVVIQLLPAILAFNVVKAAVNGVVTFLIYKPLSRFLHR
ncbi:MAG: ECF transporter S component [Anaerovoracaceae bacterium]